jgi:hypothetical protein
MLDLERGRLASGEVARALTGLPTVASVLLLVLNDHVLKRSGIVPGLVTGKLSDFAFMFFAPIVLTYLTRARTRFAVAAAFAVPTAVFVAINVSPIASDVFAGSLSTIVPSMHVCDVEDLIAVATLPLSWRYLWRKAPERAPELASHRLSWSRALVTMVASIGCMATSAPRPEFVEPQPTHQAVYMSWEEFRSTAVHVKAPQPIRARGKLLIVGDHLFLSEPGGGVHIFDNKNPKQPRALMFIEIPGNIDIAVRDGRLYADSFVDLLVFDLDLSKGTAKLAERLNDQFAYNPYQTLAADAPVLLESFDRSQGVVIRLEPLNKTTKVAQ